jgi:hypothetical protein
MQGSEHSVRSLFCFCSESGLLRLHRCGPFYFFTNFNLIQEALVRTVNCGTLSLSDDEFLRAFESCELPNSMFHHGDHIRAAWLYIRRCGESEAAIFLAQGILRFATHHGSPQKYHHTMTVAWVRLVAAAHRDTPNLQRFEDFIAAHPQLLELRGLSNYYSTARLGSTAARAGWVEPDRRRLP